LRYAIEALAIGLTLAVAEPAAAQRIRAGLLTCDVSAGIGLIITSQRQVSCAFKPDQPGRQEGYEGTITKYGLDLGATGGGEMVWAVFTDTIAGPGFLAGDYVGASRLYVWACQDADEPILRPHPRLGRSGRYAEAFLHHGIV